MLGYLSCFELRMALIIHLKHFRVILAFVLVRLCLARCEFYCDVGICLYTNFSIATSWEDAQSQCSRNGSILLEIYNKIYEDVTLKALGKFQSSYPLIGWYLLLGLECINGQFRWLTTKQTTQPQIHVAGNFDGTCKAFLIWDGNQLRIEPSCDNTAKNNRFICLKDKTNQTTESNLNQFSSPYLTSTNVLTSLFTSISQVDGNSIYTTELVNDKHQSDQQQNKNIGIGVGVGVTLAILTISLIILIVYIAKRRLENRKKIFAKEPSLPTTTSSNGTSFVYADLDFTGKTSESNRPI